MADFEGALPIKTARDDDFKVKIVDFSGGEIASNGLAIDASGAVTSLISDGTDVLAINDDGSINVVATEAAKTAVLQAYKSDEVAKNATVDFDYTVTNGKLFSGANILVGSRAACKINVGTYDGTTFVSKAVYFQLPAQNRFLNIPAFEATGDGTLKLRISVTNLDNATDVYATLQGFEKNI
jgi:hypothetical protein